MSKEIKITIVMDDEKLNAESVAEKVNTVIVTHDSSKTVMSALLQNHLISGSFCGGRGDCGRCRIRFLQGAVMPTALERSVMEPEELRQGYRLACLAKPKDDCVIKLALLEPQKIEIISDMISVTQSIDCVGQQKMQSENSKVDVMKSLADQRSAVDRKSMDGNVLVSSSEPTKTDVTELMIAVDLGTTTIAMQLIEVDTGRILDTYCEMNPQRRYGTDVLSRIQASCAGSREILQRMVMEVLERGVFRFSGACVGQKAVVRCMCIAGNTTMEHLLMGYDVSSLGSSPFTPVEIGLQEYRHPAWDFKVWLVPGISAFVGGDIVAGLYALDMLPAVCNENGNTDLMIDLGTNGEMAVTDGKRMIVTATAAGPAFEGGAGAGIVGSDMIACTAALLQQGIVDETGLLAEPYFTEGISVGDPAVKLCNKDIRDLQMAKAAVRAGVEILCRQMGEKAVGRVYLAGGFGYYLDVEAAFRIGLLPERMRGCVQAVGNTSLAGAYRIGCDLWNGRTDRQRLQERLSSIESINLARQEEFEELYVRYMDLKADENG